MTSFIRTIQRKEQRCYLEEILSRREHFIPLKGRPLRAKPGNFVYLAYRGSIVGRARIDRFESVNRNVPIGTDGRCYHARCLLHYRGGWQRCPRQVPFRGSQGIRYVDTVGLAHLDAEEWPPC